MTILLMGTSLPVRAQQISYTSDDQAFTTEEGNREVQWYDRGYTVSIQTGHNLRDLKPGEHYYREIRQGEISIQKWVVVHPYGKCIHNLYGVSDFHGVDFKRKKCGKNYFSGWFAYCADCGDCVTDMLFYMSSETAGSMKTLNVDKDYYYLCPWCRNLEQGASMEPHKCKTISANRYYISYNSNGGIGYMANSMHMYGNADRYEGREVIPQRTLSLCSYSRLGYLFTGWNTRADGTGVTYANGAEIRNLVTEEGGVLTLYAQWKPSNSSLLIDPSGGSYLGRREETVIRGMFGSSYRIQSDKLVPPSGAKVTFNTQGGNTISPITGTMSLLGWKKADPFEGRLQNGEYTFLGKDGSRNRICAEYERGAITLPTPQKEGFSFGGWYYDKEGTKPAGNAGARFVPLENVTLYANWVSLKLTAKDNYTADGGKGAVDLSWSQKDQYKKTYKLYQKKENGNWQQIGDKTDQGAVNTVDRTFGHNPNGGSYQVPYSGYYEITLSGAQGGSYGTYKGGSGGRVTGVCYLQKGEVLTFQIGCTNQLFGGGLGRVYANGGGFSYVKSSVQGDLAYAGGGGGATCNANGGPGGEPAPGDVRTNGENGQAGGGGGYIGGQAGSVTYHYHTVNCQHKHVGTPATYGGCYKTEKRCGSAEFTEVEAGHTFYYGNVDDDGNHIWCPRCGSYVCPGHLDRFYNYVCKTCGQTYERVKPASCDALTGYVLSCGRTEAYVCGLSQAQIVSYKPSTGGSNYVNVSAFQSYKQETGMQEGSGSIRIRSLNLGFVEDNYLNAVKATDSAKPDKIKDETIQRVPLDEKTIRVRFDRPADRGTVYYHKAESYEMFSGKQLGNSNVTQNTLTSGIRGYRYVLDQKSTTTVTASNAWVENSELHPSLDLPYKAGSYLHIAAQDKAGNLGDTIHISLAEDLVFWPVITEKIAIDDRAENVSAASEPDTYYVRCGEDTPFRITTAGLLCGIARGDYQVNRLYLKAASDAWNQECKFSVSCKSPVTTGTVSYTAAQIQKQYQGDDLLVDGMYTMIRRSDSCRKLELDVKMAMPSSMDGKKVYLTPAAAAINGRKDVYSEEVSDQVNGIVLIGDGTAPRIDGMEELPEEEMLEFTETENYTVHLKASDTVSGLKSFWIEIYNEDNGARQSFTADESGEILLVMEKDMPLYEGSFSVTATAIDHVGNKTVICNRMQTLTLSASVERILEPHNDVFLAGESGLLYVQTTGYVERVEITFPSEMTAYDPSLDRIIVYTPPMAVTIEELEFMIPIGTPPGEYHILVRGYKAGTELEETPELCTLTVTGSVLDELHTRLR